jgi:molybdopterin-guanine dinucleotide biosynthesis protein A
MSDSRGNAERFDAIVLAGGASSRMGGDDKALIDIGKSTLLERALAAVSDATTLVVVGPVRSTTRDVVFTRESPTGAGPAAALAQGVSLVRQSRVVVVAVDVPFAASAIGRLLAALPGHEAAMLVDSTGRRQPLLAAYETDALRGRAAERSWRDASVRAFVEGLATVDVPAEGLVALDCDTPGDVASARAALGRVDRRPN